ncbi:hypothetical protein KP509_1Z215200 [Ceratopteris richardii]|nr:hypothetical protein KP509_1Z239400 [Ceratopteris richardii]KAH6555949.1 hypothetical protein KP509_1Z215200 [Ceratopteris richardii]
MKPSFPQQFRFAVILLSFSAGGLKALDTGSTTHPTMPIESLCNTTNNASLCMSILSRYPASSPSAKLQSLTAFIVDLALVEVHSSYLVAQGLLHENNAPTNGKSTLQDCLEQMSDCRDSLKQSKRRLQHLDGHNPPLMVTAQVMDVRVWLSASLTYMETCWDELADPSAALLKSLLRGSTQNKVEPLLSMALKLSETLQQPGGTSIAYALS